MDELIESLNDALIASVKACGGSSQVGRKLWPEKTQEAAQRHLLNCLQEGRPERLSPEHVQLLLRMSRAKGYHAGVAWILRDLGYAPPQPIEPKDEAAELQRQFIESTKQLARMAERIEHLNGGR